MREPGESLKDYRRRRLIERGFVHGPFEFYSNVGLTGGLAVALFVAGIWFFSLVLVLLLGRYIYQQKNPESIMGWPKY